MPGSKLLVAVDDVVALSRRPIDGTRVTVVSRWAELELCPADDDRGLRETVEAADVVDIAVGDQHVCHVARLDSCQRELRGREVLGGEGDDTTEGVEALRRARGDRVIDVARRETGVDEDDAVAGADHVADDRDDPVALLDLEAAIVEESELQRATHGANHARLRGTRWTAAERASTLPDR